MSVRIPKYRHHKPTGQALVEIRGRRIYLGKHGTEESKQKYRRLIAELVTGDGSNSTPDSASVLTVNQLILKYFNFAKTYYVKNGKPTDEVAALRAIFKRLRGLYGISLAQDFGPKRFRALRESLINERLSRKYINDSMARVRRMFKWAVAEELIAPNVYQALSSVPGLRQGRSKARETGRVLPVSDSVVEATLPYLPQIVADMVRLQLITGMRLAEICMIRPRDIDRKGEVWIYRPASHKTEHADKERSIPLGPRAQSLLVRYLPRETTTYCFQPSESEKKRLAIRAASRITPANLGNRHGTNRVSEPKRQAGSNYTTASYRRAIQRACDKAFPHQELSGRDSSSLTTAKLEELRTWKSNHRWSPNQLRHSAATRFRENYGLEAAQVLLGHSKADVTQIYAERDLTKAIEVAKKIG